MHKLVLKNGLLYTSVTLRHEGKSAIVKDVIVDTGAFHTIIIIALLPFKYPTKYDTEYLGGTDIHIWI